MAEVRTKKNVWRYAEKDASTLKNICYDKLSKKDI